MMTKTGYNMTNIDAIEILECKDPTKYDIDEINIAINMAIEALRKEEYNTDYKPQESISAIDRLEELEKEKLFLQNKIDSIDEKIKFIKMSCSPYNLCVEHIEKQHPESINIPSIIKTKNVFFNNEIYGKDKIICPICKKEF